VTPTYLTFPLLLDLARHLELRLRIAQVVHLQDGHLVGLQALGRIRELLHARLAPGGAGELGGDEHVINVAALGEPRPQVVLGIVCCLRGG
jgi:hypothetical protein